MSFDAQRHLQQAKAKHQLSTIKFDTATSSIYDLLDEEPVELSSVVATLMDLQEAGSLQQDCSAFLVCGLEATVSSLCTMESKVAALSADAANAKFLATYRDPIKRWFTRRAKLLGMDWPTLAGKLDLEQEDSDEEDTDSPSCTENLKASLEKDSYSWQDWLDIRSIADAANSGFHLGKNVSPKDALKKLDCGEHKLPQSLQRAEGPLRKALTSLINK